MKTYKKKFISLIIFSHDFSGVLIFFVLSKKTTNEGTIKLLAK